MAIAAAVLIRMAMQDLGVLGAGEAARGEDMADGLQRLQVMMSSWSLDPLNVVQTQRDVFPITPNKGVYTIGPGLEFDVARPVGQQSLVGAGLILLGTNPEVEIPRTVLTYDMYQRIQIKTLTSGQFTQVFYRPGALQRFPAGSPTPPHGIEYGEILLWPIPTEANPLVLYLQKVLPLFQDLTTLYPIPDGYLAAIQYNLVLAMASMFSVKPSEESVRNARLSLASMKRNNYQLIDAPIDPMFTMQTPSGGYDINSGETRRG